MMAHELEEERRRDKFYNIDPSLPDDDYFTELAAKVSLSEAQSPNAVEAQSG